MHDCCCFNVKSVENYPREGTETCMIVVVSMSKALKIIPVRGRKPAVKDTTDQPRS